LAWTADGLERVETEGSTLGEVWDNLDAAYPELMWRLSAEPGRPSFWVRVMVDGQAMEHPTRLETPLADGAELAVHIIPGSGVAAGAASGGKPPPSGGGSNRR
jgi:hypothetical protein